MTTTSTTWTEDAQGFMKNGGDVGGDYQVSAAPCRRFIRTLDNGEYAFVDIYAFVEVRYLELGADGNRTGTESAHDNGSSERSVDITVMNMWGRCTDITDPGSSETFGDVSYEHPYSIVPQYDDDKALADATAYIRNLSAADILWDGIRDIQH